MENTKEILRKYKKIALVGASKDITKTSSIVMKYLQKYGFKVYPVNPSMKGEEILGEKVKIISNNTIATNNTYPLWKAGAAMRIKNDCKKLEDENDGLTIISPIKAQRTDIMNYCLSMSDIH